MTTDIELYSPDRTAEHEQTIRDVEIALGKLASNGSRTQIAAYLVQHGHDGYRGQALACPVFDFVIAAVPAAEGDIAVGRGGWTLYTLDGRSFCGTLPEPVAAFVNRFDAGDYPSLVRGCGDPSCSCSF